MHTQSHHTTVRVYRLTTLTILILLVWLAGGCADPAAVTPDPSATVQVETPTREPTSTPTQSATETPSPSATPLETKPSPTSAPITQLEAIRDAGLVAEDQGWVISAQRLLWTSDGGDSWLDITPVHQGELIITNAFFLGADQGWVVMIPPPEVEQVSIEILVFYSQDGGETWEQNSWQADLPFGVYSGLTDLKFIDSQTGWLVVNQTMTMNASAADLYRTQDGGLTWQMSQLPYNGAVHFINAEVGWTIGSCCTGASRQLFRSQDGGQTWDQQAFVPNPVEDGFDYHDYHLPIFFDQQEGLLAVLHKDVFYDVVEVGIYRTTDGGSSWQPVTTFSPDELAEPGPGAFTQVQFLQPEYWIAAVGKSIYVTDDAGESWTRLEQDTLPGFHYRLMFASENMGWSVLFRDNCGDNCLLLYQTGDGGETWEALGEQR
ncbi:MAG: hypothetical protein IBX69_15550 [Anaerolineales bacterium]|nr:hypothetical protein [Anaerolineales bacterium]